MPRSPAVNAKPSSRFSVFDFNDDDHPEEKTYKGFNRRSGNRKQPKRHASPMTKYTFLECFVGSKETVDVDNKGPPQKKGSFEPIVVDDGPVRTCSAVVEGFDGLSMDISDQGYDQGHPVSYPSQKDRMMEDTTPLVLSSDSDNEIYMQSSVSPMSTSPEKEGLSCNQVREFGSAGHKIDSINSTVVVFPDYVCYGDAYCTSSQLTFSCHCVRVEASNINGTTGMLNAEWAVNDIVGFQSQWSEKVESALVKLHFRSKISTGSGDGYETPGTESLKFAAYDPHWFEGLEAIKSLNVQYANVWNSASVEEVEDGSSGCIRSSASQPSFSRLTLDGNHKEVVYPIDDPDAVLISTRDLALLQPETFINDTIIDFYVKYLINNKIRQEDQNRFHFFNCFFFRKLADLDEHPPSVCEGEAAFQRVYKWTKKLDLFQKDYLFIPVNYSFHWSLIVICHPGEVAVPKGTYDRREKTAKIPCILHMDSIQGSHKGLKNLFQSYLAEEWKVRHQDMVDDVSSKFADLRYIQLELPQQSNSFDCGLFLLHYLELFLEEAPANFNPSNLSDFSNFLNKNWFPPDEASLKRRHIQKLLSEVLLLDSIHRDPSSENCDAHNKDIVVEVLGEKLVSSKTHLADSLRSDIELGTGNSAMVASPPGGSVEQSGDVGMEDRMLSEPGTSLRSLYDEAYQRQQTHYSINLSPVQETEECVLATEDCFPGTQDPVLPTEDCFHETPECVLATEDCFPGTQDSVLPTEDNVRETQDCVLATEDCFPETPECMLATENCLLGTGKSPTGIPFVGMFTSPGAPRKHRDVHVEDDCEIVMDLDEDDLHSASEQSQHRHTETRKLEFLSASSSQVIETYVIEDSEEENVVEDSIISIRSGGRNRAVVSNDQFDYMEDTGEEVSSKTRTYPGNESVSS
ncbi:Probable ubiquitin-like-specific protease 2A [Linum grandiflorum]